MEDIKSSDLLVECEKACGAIGWNYANIFESTCFYSGANTFRLNVYDEMKKIYESQHDPIHKIIITDKPVSIQCIMEAIKSRTAYIILPRPADNLSRAMILQDLYTLFDYIAGRTATNYKNYKKSFCKKCKSCKVNKVKIVNAAPEYKSITEFVAYLDGQFKYITHEC